MLSNNGFCLRAAAQYTLLLSVLVVNSDLFQILRSYTPYSSRLFLCTLATAMYMYNMVNYTRIHPLQVRRSVSNTVKRLQSEIPGIRIAVIAHGDYCDAHTYVTKIVDFTTDGKKLCDFVQNVQGTG